VIRPLSRRVWAGVERSSDFFTSPKNTSNQGNSDTINLIFIDKHRFFRIENALLGNGAGPAAFPRGQEVSKNVRRKGGLISLRDPKNPLTFAAYLNLRFHPHLTSTRQDRFRTARCVESMRGGSELFGARAYCIFLNLKTDRPRVGGGQGH